MRERDVLVSIIIPCYNHNEEVKSAIRSALGQDFPNGKYEIIVIDDGSDTPVEYPDERVRIMRLRTNQGLVAALNAGIANSIGEYFVILAADDYFRKNFLKETYAAAVERGVDIVSTDFQGHNRTIRCRPGNLELLKKHNCHSYAALTHSSWWHKTGGYKEMNPSWEDWEFWLNCAKLGAVWHHIPKPLHVYHRNPIGRDADAQNKGNMLRGLLEGHHQDIYGIGAGVVCFVIPSYNHEQYLNECVMSVLSQTYPHCVISIVNDASTTVSHQEFESYVPRANNVLINHHVKNSGLSATRNTGIDAALRAWNPEYFIMLDADDSVSSNYVEVTLSKLDLESKNYVYTNIQLIGDAYHKYELREYDCVSMIKKHIHPCTFLMHTNMLLDIKSKYRSYYDEAMKDGFEDREFALRAVRSGWCGQLYKGHLFNYRNHVNGSMRTRAQSMEKKLSAYIRNKHPWIVRPEEVAMACGGCGSKGKFTKQVAIAQANAGGLMTKQLFIIPGIGEVTGDTPIKVRYIGGTTSTVTKTGVGTVYKFSANPEGTFGPNFMAMAKDYHLFSGGRYKIMPFVTEEVIEAPVQVPAPARAPVPVVEVKELIASGKAPLIHDIMAPKEPDADKEVIKTEAYAGLVLKEKELVLSDALIKAIEDEEKIVLHKEHPGVKADDPPDNLTEIVGVGPASDKKLKAAGLIYIEHVADSNSDRIAELLIIGRAKAMGIILDAKRILGEL